ncbi:hypothetical protein QQP08_022119 [Theobroma cacao]|nr:hypothetical protein QQP08_022119 [Theobroma cacao]
MYLVYLHPEAVTSISTYYCNPINSRVWHLLQID